MKKILLTAFFAVLSIWAFSQSASDIYNMSEYNYGLGTARSAAMGGAFGSLGADPASININPAGLGMYRSSEASFSPSVRISNSYTDSYLNGDKFSDKGKLKSFNVSNLAGVLNIYNSNDKRSFLTTANIAVSYNRMASYNTKQYAYSGNETSSIGDMFSAQLYGVNPEYVYNSKDNLQPYKDANTYYWGGILAYNTGLLFNSVDQFGKDKYSLAYRNDQGNMQGSLFEGDLVSPALFNDIRGNISEYSFAVGFEFFNRLNVGATFGFQDYRYDQYSYYNELANRNNGGDLAELEYSQSLRYSAASFSFKFGATMKVAEGTRIGLAVHAPNLYSVNTEYSAAMNNYFFNDDKTYSQDTPYFVSNMRLNTATRVIASVSQVVKKRLILSFDYERVWYNKMRVKNIANYKQGVATLNDDIFNIYNAVNNYRAGVEVHAGRGMYLRGGYAYYSTPLKSIDDKKYGAVRNISGGVGYKTRYFYADVAYVNIARDFAPTKYYGEMFGDVEIASQSTINSRQNNNNIILTIGFRY